MSDYIEMAENGQQSTAYLQSVLGIAQSRLNDMMIKSINDEAQLRQKINSLQAENEKLSQEVERLTPGKGNYNEQTVQRKDNNGGGQSQITMSSS